jgi:hypothetical protein
MMYGKFPTYIWNLFSVSKHDDIGHDSYLCEGKWKITKGSLIVARGSGQGCYHVTRVKLCNEVLNFVGEDSNLRGAIRGLDI